MFSSTVLEILLVLFLDHSVSLHVLTRLALFLHWGHLFRNRGAPRSPRTLSGPPPGPSPVPLVSALSAGRVHSVRNRNSPEKLWSIEIWSEGRFLLKICMQHQRWYQRLVMDVDIDEIEHLQEPTLVRSSPRTPVPSPRLEVFGEVLEADVDGGTILWHILARVDCVIVHEGRHLPLVELEAFLDFHRRVDSRIRSNGEGTGIGLSDQYKTPCLSLVALELGICRTLFPTLVVCGEYVDLNRRSGTAVQRYSSARD